VVRGVGAAPSPASVSPPHSPLPLPLELMSPAQRRSTRVTLKNECLEDEIVSSLREAQVVMGAWRDHSNRVRPHSAPPASVTLETCRITSSPDGLAVALPRVQSGVRGSRVGGGWKAREASYGLRMGRLTPAPSAAS
jgi:hypothetical protein